MEIPVYDMQGTVVDQVQVDEELFGGEPNLALLRQAILMYEANRRVGTASAKNRGQVAGSGRKMRPQKHTGRSRQGDKRNPLWVGGGVVHGPRPRNWRQKMNRTARRQALYSAFLAKASDGEVIALDRLELPEAKTKHMASVLKNLGVERTALVVVPQYDQTLWRCTRNIPGVGMTAWQDLNAYEMIRPRRVIFLLEALRAFIKRAEELKAPQRAEVSSNG